MNIQNVRIYLSNGEMAEIKVKTKNIHDWVDTVAVRGMHSDDLFIPPSSISYIKFGSVEEQEELEVEYEQEED